MVRKSQGEEGGGEGDKCHIGIAQSQGNHLFKKLSQFSSFIRQLSLFVFVGSRCLL